MPVNTYAGWLSLGEQAPFPIPCSGINCHDCLLFEFLRDTFLTTRCGEFVRDNPEAWTRFRDYLHQQLDDGVIELVPEPTRAPIPVACRRISCYDCQWRQFLGSWRGGFHEACLNAPPEAWRDFLIQLRRRNPHAYVAANTPIGWLALGPVLPRGNDFYCTVACSDCLFNQFLRRTGRVNPSNTSCYSILESPEGQTIWQSFREEMRRMLNWPDGLREIPAPDPVPTSVPTNHTNSGGDNMPLRASSDLRLFELGMDPEFELYRGGRIVNASRHWISQDYASGNIGLDGSGMQIELRPNPAISPDDLVRNVHGLFRDFMAASSSPPRDLGIQGNRYPLGAHIHFGLKPRIQEGNRERDVHKFVSILDWALGGIILPLSGRARKESYYYSLGGLRVNDHGFEYRSLPSAIFVSPTVLRVVLKVCWNLGQDFFNSDGVNAKFQPGDMAGWDRLRTVARLDRLDIDILQELVYNYESMPKRIRATWLGESESTSCSTQTTVIDPVVQAGAAEQDITVDPNSLLAVRPDDYQDLGDGIFVRYNSGDTFGQGMINELNARLSAVGWGHQVPGRGIRIFFFGLSAERGEHVVSCNCNGRHYAPRSRMGSWRPLRVLCSAARANEIAVGLPFRFRTEYISASAYSIYSSADVDSLLEMIRFVSWQVSRRH